MAEKYDIELPAYQGIEQIVEAPIQEEKL